jgi:hypothetical protein
MFDWHGFRTVSGNFERELQEEYFSPSKGEDSTSPLTPHQCRDDETQSSVPMLLATGTTTITLIFCQFIYDSTTANTIHRRASTVLVPPPGPTKLVYGVIEE